jgi:hypothetical protein
VTDRPKCGNPIRHSPPPAVVQRHHIQPKSWGGPDVEDNIIALCGTCHDGVHTALNALVRANGPAPSNIWGSFHHFYRKLALQAVSRAGGVVKKYTAPYRTEA